MHIAGRGRILIWEGASLWIMEALPEKGATSNTTDFHSHHAVQVTLSLGGRFQLRTADHSLAADSAVAPDVSHIFEATGLNAILFIEPESRAGRAIVRRLFNGAILVPIPPGLATSHGRAIYDRSYSLAANAERLGHAMASADQVRQRRHAASP